MISTTTKGRTAGATLGAIFAAAPLVGGQTPAPDQPAPPAQQSEQSQFFFSPWTKFCLKGQEPDAKQVCFSGKEGRIERGESYSGPATDPKVFEEQQRALQQELARRAEEARERLRRFHEQSPQAPNR